MKDSILRLCLRTYPSASRKQDGRAILDLARDLSEESRFSFLREAGGLLSGGVRERGKLLRLDIAGAPWRAAQERLALPLAVGILCLLVAFVASLPHSPWSLAWAYLTLAGAATAVFGAVSGRRLLATTASFAVLGLMLLPTLFELVGHAAVWSGSIPLSGRSGIGVDVFVLWIPVAVLLPICARAVGSERITRRLNVGWIICAAVAVSAISGLAPRLLPTPWTVRIPIWPEWLGGAFIWVPLILIAVTVVTAFIRRDPVAETAAALLVAAGSFPMVWVLPALIPIRIIPAPWFSSSFWFLCYTPPVLAICIVAWLLLRHRRTRIVA